MYVMDDIQLSRPETPVAHQRGGNQDVAKLLSRDTLNVMITADAYSAGAYVLTKDSRFGRTYGSRLRNLGAHVYIVTFE
jgi:hypothetical protein